MRSLLEAAICSSWRSTGCVPPNMPASWGSSRTQIWVNRVRYALIASSLFTMDGDQPFFWHQSLAEYVAAAPRGKDFDRAVWRREITSPSTRSLALFRLGRSSEDPGRVVRYLRAADPVAAGYVLVDGVTVSAGLRLSVVDGLIAAGQGDGATAVE